MIGRRCFTALILIILILVFAHARSQSVNTRFNFKHLTVQNGLAENIVYHFLQDSRGYMWIGTHNGLTLYDGVKTINFLPGDHDSTSVSGRFITGLLEDPGQQIWIGNENGINRYNRGDNTFSHFAVDRPGGKKDTTYCVPLGFNTATDLWFLDTKTRSVRSLNTKTKQTSFVSEMNTTHALFYKCGQSVNLWAAYDKGTIHQVFTNGKLIKQQIFFADKNKLGQPVLEVTHVYQQDDSTAWLSTNEGLTRLNPVSGNYKICNRWGNRVIKEIRYATLSPKGQLWLGTGPEGVYTFDIKTNQYLDNFRFDKADAFSICSDNIVSLYFDKMNNVWCGSYGGGASYTSLENVFFDKHISKKDLNPWENDLTIDWVGYDRYQNLWCMFAATPGFMVLDKELRIIKRVYPLLQDGKAFIGYINKLLPDPEKDQIWCATNKGLMLYDMLTSRVQFIKYPLLNEELMGSIWINDIIRLKDSSFIFSTFGGLYRLTREKNKTIIKPFTSLNQQEHIGFRLLFQDEEGFLYVKSTGEVLFILKPGSRTGEYEIIKRIDFSPDIRYFFYDKSKQTTWFATAGGLYYLNTRDFQLHRSESNSQLPFSAISSVFKKDDRFWIFGEKGAYVLDEKTGTGRTLTVEDGLPSNEFSISALTIGPDQRCIAGTSNGIVSFFPGQLPGSTLMPGAQFTNIYVNDVLHATAPNSNELKKISLKPRENTFSIDFSAIVFQHIADYRFEYRLDNYDEHWIKGGSARYTRYSKLPPGKYVFNLRVIDPQGKVSPYSKTVEIEIAHAFWQTLAFRIASSVLALVAVWVVLKWFFNQRIKKQRLEFEKQQAIERERTRIATDMHDDLGAGLSRIKFLSESIRSKKGNDAMIDKDIEKISAYSDEMAEKMGEIVWALNEKNDTVADLVAFTRSYANEYLSGQNIRCIFNTPLNLPGAFITGEMRQNIFLSVKECLHNIVKHAHASEVYFSIRLNGRIEITIHDNGKGIDWDGVRPFSNGLQNIQRRMSAIKGKAVFNNQQGTKVVLTVPMSL